MHIPDGPLQPWLREHCALAVVPHDGDPTGPQRGQQAEVQGEAKGESHHEVAQHASGCKVVGWGGGWVGGGGGGGYVPATSSEIKITLPESRIRSLDPLINMLMLTHRKHKKVLDSAQGLRQRGELPSNAVAHSAAVPGGEHHHTHAKSKHTAVTSMPGRGRGDIAMLECL